MREATIRIPDGEFEQLGIGAFVSRCRAAGLRDLTELACQRSGCLLVATVASPLPEDELTALEEIEWWERLGTGDVETIYLCKIRLQDHDDAVHSFRDRQVSNGELDVADDGIRVSFVGSQAGIAENVNEYEKRGVNVVLQRLGEYDGPENALDALTDRQREIVRTAFDRGYFDVPRTASTDDIAAELDLDSSTVAEHLQRAERNLLATLFGER